MRRAHKAVAVKNKLCELGGQTLRMFGEEDKALFDADCQL